MNCKLLNTVPVIGQGTCCFFMFAGTQSPLTQPPPAVQASYQPARQQQQLPVHAEPHYATPRPSQYAMQQAPQRDSQYDSRQPAYRQYEEQPYGGPQQSSWQQAHTAYDQRHHHHQQQQPRRESQYQQQQPAYSAQLRHPYEPQHQPRPQAAYPPQHGRVASAFEPPYVTRDGRIAAAGRSKSASDLNQPPEAAGPTQPSLQYGHAHRPQEPLSSWKSYEGPGQRGLAADVATTQEPVKVDRRQLDATSDARRVSPDAARPYSEHWAAADWNRQAPYWREAERRSQPQLNAVRQQPADTATRLSHPELTSGTRQFVDAGGRDAAPFTSSDMLRRAQPSQQGVTSPTPFTQQVSASGSTSQGTLERRTSVPVGGHLRAIDPKQQMAPVLPPTASEHRRPQSYYPPPSQMTAGAGESAYARPADRSQSLSRAVQPGSGPWERAQKEEEQKHVELEQKRRRDEEIRHLEARLPDQLSPAEIDRLRRLKLNAEFDRRATELERTGDQSADVNTDMTPAVSDFSARFTCVFFIHCLSQKFVGVIRFSAFRLDVVLSIQFLAS